MFFGLVALCGVFFGVGYSLGRNSAHVVEPVAVAGLTPSVATSAPKPSAGHAANAKPDCADPKGCGDAANTTDELTFYKSVEQKDANAQLQQPVTPAAATPAAAPATTAAAAPELSGSGSVSGGYMVQVAAVTKQEDADALVNALRQ
ncbi:MAG TPA: hypothetical protein VFU76_01745, partial [Terriglobales bacterium]|nr:hypothetical protein [Terriglobales bacterium]